ncbi:uncharacterized protein UHOD_11168 [Ustilago sp. UG-2017b]|nr:uncharacterized protein UHOD_11168 [Ustilago sp. UG-2017b]
MRMPAINAFGPFPTAMQCSECQCLLVSTSAFESVFASIFSKNNNFRTEFEQHSPLSVTLRSSQHNPGQNWQLQDHLHLMTTTATSVISLSFGPGGDERLPQPLYDTRFNLHWMKLRNRIPQRPELMKMRLKLPWFSSPAPNGYETRRPSDPPLELGELRLQSHKQLQSRECVRPPAKQLLFIACSDLLEHLSMPANSTHAVRNNANNPAIVASANTGNASGDPQPTTTNPAVDLSQEPDQDTIVAIKTGRLV